MIRRWSENVRELPHGQLLSLAQVADLCTVSSRTVRRWIHDGLPAHRLPGNGARGILRVSYIDLEDWIDHHRCALDADPTQEQAICLEGRRFMATPRSDGNYGLDDRHQARPGVARREEP